MEKINREELEELKVLSQPLVDFLYKYYNPHAMILITMTSAEVVETDIGVPFAIRD